MCGLPPEHHQLTRDHTLKENFLSWEFSVSISSLPRSGPLCPPPSPRLDLGPFEHARILCRLSQPLWIYTCSCPEKLLLSVDGGCHRDPQLVWMRRISDCRTFVPKWDICIIALPPKDQRGHKSPRNRGRGNLQGNSLPDTIVLLPPPTFTVE